MRKNVISASVLRPDWYPCLRCCLHIKTNEGDDVKQSDRNWSIYLKHFLPFLCFSVSPEFSRRWSNLFPIPSNFDFLVPQNSENFWLLCFFPPTSFLFIIRLSGFAGRALDFRKLALIHKDAVNLLQWIRFSNPKSDRLEIHSAVAKTLAGIQPPWRFSQYRIHFSKD